MSTKRVAEEGIASTGLARLGSYAGCGIGRLKRNVEGFFFSSRRPHTSSKRDWSSDVCSSDLVAVDPETGFIELLDFAVAEDCGTMVNPMIVEGQIRGGVAQGIGTALYEEIPYDAQGQPLAVTFADYLIPGAAEVPAIKVGHMHTPASATEYGMKGMGEGGAVAPPAAIANAVRDALAAMGTSPGAEVNETPLTAARVSAAIQKAKAAS